MPWSSYILLTIINKKVIELSKIKCAKKHFEEISQDVQLIQTKSFDKLEEHI